MKQKDASPSGRLSLSHLGETIMQAVYLLHFHEPINPNRPAQHYLGWSLDLSRRIRQHKRGKGARLTSVAKERGISFTVARVWVGGDRRLERQLKNRKNGPKLCPFCHPVVDPNPEIEF